MQANEYAITNLNGSTVSLGELLSAQKLFQRTETPVFMIPGYQRNYKWNKETAKMLAQDLITAYTEKKDKSIGLITLYKGPNGSIEVLDGQQRLISLWLICHSIGTPLFQLSFERDTSLDDSEKRPAFVSALKVPVPDQLNATTALSDKRRFQCNFKEISDICKDIHDPKNFIAFLKKHLRFLLHITNTEPVAEFLNINCHKTRFSICDRVRSALIIDFGATKEELAEFSKSTGQIDYKAGISILFEELTRLLYRDDIYDVVRLGYTNPEDTHENRINIMFTGLTKDSQNGYLVQNTVNINSKEEWRHRLLFYKSVLCELEADVDNKDYITKNAFANLHNSTKKHGEIGIRFFELLDQEYDRFKGHTDDPDKLAKILHERHSLDKIMADYVSHKSNEVYTDFVNSYFQLLMNESNTHISPIASDLLNGQVSDSPFFATSRNAIETLIHTSGKYLLYRYIDARNKRKFGQKNKWADLPTSANDETALKQSATSQYRKLSSAISLRELLNLPHIVIPVIQRDYCMPNHFRKSSEEKRGTGDFIDFLLNSFQGIYQKEDLSKTPFSAITVYQTGGILYLYDGQQRIVTLYAILRMLQRELGEDSVNCKILFEDRPNFTHQFNRFLDDLHADEGKTAACNYAQTALQNLAQVFNQRLADTLSSTRETKQNFLKYLLDCTSIDVIHMEASPSALEQFFMEINDGVPLVPYEIFKSKINEKANVCLGQNSDKYRLWLGSLDNQWLDAFYRFERPTLQTETAAEELKELRLIEFCCRMMYWGKLDKDTNYDPTYLDSFANSENASDIGDSDVFIESLNESDFTALTETITNLAENIHNLKSGPIVQFIGGIERSNLVLDPLSPKRPYLNFPYFEESHAKASDFTFYVLYSFIKTLDCDAADFCTYKNQSNPCKGIPVHCSYQNQRKTDLVAWAALNDLCIGNESHLASEMAFLWNHSLCSSPIAYFTPTFLSKYKGLTLPIPVYYYADPLKADDLRQNLVLAALYKFLYHRQDLYPEQKFYNEKAAIHCWNSLLFCMTDNKAVRPSFFCEDPFCYSDDSLYHADAPERYITFFKSNKSKIDDGWFSLYSEQIIPYYNPQLFLNGNEIHRAISFWTPNKNRLKNFSITGILKDPEKWSYTFCDPLFPSTTSPAMIFYSDHFYVYDGTYRDTLSKALSEQFDEFWELYQKMLTVDELLEIESVKEETKQLYINKWKMNIQNNWESSLSCSTIHTDAYKDKPHIFQRYLLPKHFSS